MSDFVRVSDDLRQKRTQSGKPASALNVALSEGQTIFVPLNGRTEHQIQSAAHAGVKRRGWNGVKSFHTAHEGVEGLVLWAWKEAE